ncbi:unnamed protein product [Schistosoma margrebowiei]|uniref:Uncharacterized protein n=1 Tax=Schistosoma margrebowiei TaxID=48269 RepID=A0A183MU59_9TREM|nr:unnamed protein product [Schistosoma margrebowiei]
MGDESIECLSNDSGDSWDILSNSESEMERDPSSQPQSNCLIVCANCGDLLSDEFLQLCKNCYVCIKCKAKSPLATKCTEVGEHSFIPTLRLLTSKDVSNLEGILGARHTSVRSHIETASLPSHPLWNHPSLLFPMAGTIVPQGSTMPDRSLSQSQLYKQLLIVYFYSIILEYVEVEAVPSSPTTDEHQDKKCTNKLSQGDSSILNVLLQFLRNNNQSTIEPSLFDSKLLLASNLESSFPKTFHPHHTTVQNVLLNMDDSSAFQSWFNLGSSLGNTRRKQESLSSNSSSSSLSSELSPENISQHYDSFPSITTSLVGVTSGRFTVSSSSPPLTATKIPTALKRESLVGSSGDNSPNRSSSSSDFSPQSSICSLSSSPLGAATQFLKSVVNWNTLIDITYDIPVDNWSKPFTSTTTTNNNNNNNNKQNIQCNNSSGKQNSSLSLSSSVSLTPSYFPKSVNINNNCNINHTIGINTAVNSIDNNNKRTVWDNERLREVINPKPLPSTITETFAYNLR